MHGVKWNGEPHWLAQFGVTLIIPFKNKVLICLSVSSNLSMFLLFNMMGAKPFSVPLTHQRRMSPASPSSHSFTLNVGQFVAKSQSWRPLYSFCAIRSEAVNAWNLSLSKSILWIISGIWRTDDPTFLWYTSLNVLLCMNIHDKALSWKSSIGIMIRQGIFLRIWFKATFSYIFLISFSIQWNFAPRDPTGRKIHLQGKWFSITLMISSFISISVIWEF